MNSPTLNLGRWCQLTGGEGGDRLLLPTKHLVTHGVVLGMTGSGKTGLVTVLVEEALAAGVPTIVIDVKGDLPNLLLRFPNFDPEVVGPWLADSGDAVSSEVVTERLAARRVDLAKWSITATELANHVAKTRAHAGLVCWRAAALAVRTRAPLEPLGHGSRGGT